MKNTGIPINFGIAVVLGFLIGTAIAGQTFYNFTLENLRYFGTLKAMGATNGILLRMILLQALVVGALGYGLGVGGAALFGYLMGGTELSFRLIPEILILRRGRHRRDHHLFGPHQHPQGDAARAGHRFQDVGGICRKTERRFLCGA